MNQPTVYLVDDDDQMRDSLEVLLRASGYVASAFSCADDFLQAYHPQMCGCLLVDQQMPGTTGLQLVEELRAADPGFLPVIFITAFADVPLAVAAMKEGAIDFMEKPFDRTALLVQIDRCFEQDALRKGRRVRQAQLAEKFARLSARERETLELLRQGLPNKSIAATLELTERAVEMRRARIMQKLDVHSAAELFDALCTFRQQCGEL